MGWRENLRPASFRGVPFFIDSAQFTGGRRVTLHEYPDRDDAYPEDLGRAGRTDKIDGHLLGDDYLDKKTKLIEALEKYGPGELIHPYYGTLFVQIGAVSVDEVTGEGGICKISFQAYKMPAALYPKPIDDKHAVLASNVDAAMAASKKDFDKKFSVASMPGFAVDSARGLVGKTMDNFNTASKGVRATADGLANLAFGIRNFRAETTDLLTAPARLSQRLIDSLGLLEGALSFPAGKLKAYSGLFVAASGNLLGTAATPTRVREASNTDAFNQLINRTSTAQAAAAAAEVPFASVEESVAAREDLNGKIDMILLAAEDEEVYSAFQGLQGALMKALPDEDADLPNIKSVTLKDTMPSLVVAYDLTERKDAESDLIARNKIRNPAFIMGGTTLEVVNAGTRA